MSIFQQMRGSWEVQEQGDLKPELFPLCVVLQPTSASAGLVRPVCLSRRLLQPVCFSRRPLLLVCFGRRLLQPICFGRSASVDVCLSRRLLKASFASAGQLSQRLLQPNAIRRANCPKPFLGMSRAHLRARAQPDSHIHECNQEGQLP